MNIDYCGSSIHILAYVIQYTYTRTSMTTYLRLLPSHLLKMFILIEITKVVKHSNG